MSPVPSFLLFCIFSQFHGSFSFGMRLLLLFRFVLVAPFIIFSCSRRSTISSLYVCDAFAFCPHWPRTCKSEIEKAGVRRARMQNSRRTRSGRQGCANLPAPVRSRRRRTSCCRRWSRTSTQDVISKEQVTRYHGWLQAVQTVVVAFGISSERSQTPDVLLN